MRVEIVRQGDNFGTVYQNVRSVMLLGKMFVITIVDDTQYEIPVDEIMTMITENR